MLTTRRRLLRFGFFPFSVVVAPCGADSCIISFIVKIIPDRANYFHRLTRLKRELMMKRDSILFDADQILLKIKNEHAFVKFDGYCTKQKNALAGVVL